MELNKRYKVASSSGLWDEVVVEVDDKGFICGIEPALNQSITVGAKFESMKKLWESFSGDQAYKIEEIKNGV